MERNAWTPDGVSTDRPSPARMYDYFLGGYHNFEIDRLAADRAAAIYPDIGLSMRANRAFLRRAVNFLIDQGIEQFLDIGSGIPTAGNVHEIVHSHDPNARVIYVDIDPVAIQHSRAILQGNPNVAVIQADAREARQVIEHEEVRRLIDFDAPIGVLLVAVLHFIPDDGEALNTVRSFREAIPPGSYVAIAHGTIENVPASVIEQLAQLYAGTTNPAKARSRDEIAQFFEGLDLVEPGLVYAPLWRPEGPEDLFLDEPERSTSFVGVGHKP